MTDIYKLSPRSDTSDMTDTYRGMVNVRIGERINPSLSRIGINFINYVRNRLINFPLRREKFVDLNPIRADLLSRDLEWNRNSCGDRSAGEFISYRITGCEALFNRCPCVKKKNRPGARDMRRYALPISDIRYLSIRSNIAENTRSYLFCHDPPYVTRLSARLHSRDR